MRANDGYFNNMVLTAIPVENNRIICIIIAAAVCVLVIVLWIIIRQRNKEGVTQKIYLYFMYGGKTLVIRQ